MARSVPYYFRVAVIGSSREGSAEQLRVVFRKIVENHPHCQFALLARFNGSKLSHQARDVARELGWEVEDFVSQPTSVVIVSDAMVCIGGSADDVAMVADFRKRFRGLTDTSRALPIFEYN